MRLTVNGTVRHIPEVWRDETLLNTLREHLGLVGAKYSCGIGVCGACKVQVDGVPVNSCTVRTLDVANQSVRTVEGLARPDGGLHPLQQAWIDERVPQCGYCQAGQLVQAEALLARNPRPSRDDVVVAMSENLCRCGTYDRIAKAILRAADEIVKAKADG